MAEFVGKKVQVVGTSRDELNGQIGTGRKFDPSTDGGRVTIKLDSDGRKLALRPQNLKVIREAKRSTGIGDIPCPPGMDPAQFRFAKDQLNRYIRRIQRKVPEWLTLQIMGYMFLGLLVLLFAVVGLLRAVILSVLVAFTIVVFLVFPSSKEDIKGKTMEIGAEVARRLQRSTGVEFSRFMGVGVVMFFWLAIVYWCLEPVCNIAAIGGEEESSGQTIMSLAQAYERGFEDARNGQEYGASVPADIFGQATDPPAAAEGGGFGLGSMMTVLMLGNQIWSLGKSPEGKWNHNTALASLKALPWYRSIFFGLLILRLFGLSPF